MILNVSGRTDIVAFYSKWFINCYRKGFIDVRNPFNKNLVNRIYFKDVDAILFCTKNPLPILPYIKEIKIPFIFHITITPYKKDIEPAVLAKGCIIENVKKLSKLIGKDKIVIRYDPVFLSEKYNLNYHKKAFANLCKLLKGYTNKIIISFIDDYKNVRKNMNVLRIIPFKENDFKEIGLSFSKSASENDMTVSTCAEKRDLTEYGFVKDECMSKDLAYKLTGKTNFKKWIARGSKYCNCVQMVDIGSYNSCPHLCKYCYANFDEDRVMKNFQKHDINSSLLTGSLKKEDTIKVRQK